MKPIAVLIVACLLAGCAASPMRVETRTAVRSAEQERELRAAARQQLIWSRGEAGGGSQ